MDVTLIRRKKRLGNHLCARARKKSWRYCEQWGLLACAGCHEISMFSGVRAGFYTGDGDSPGPHARDTMETTIASALREQIKRDLQRAHDLVLLTLRMRLCIRWNTAVRKHRPREWVPLDVPLFSTDCKAIIKSPFVFRSERGALYALIFAHLSPSS